VIKPAIGAVTSRWVLYHGTSTRRFKTILKEGILRTSNPGEPTIALTTERSVTEYFACNVVAGDRHDHPEDESSGTVLVLDAEWLLSLNYDLAVFQDTIWGEGECDWENEIACWNDIELLDEVLIAVEPVAPRRFREFTRRRRKAFRPAIPPIVCFRGDRDGSHDWEIGWG
jgi:hypothetical protein